MARSIKIFLIILGLGILILPKQMVFAQKAEKCCTQKTEDQCCKKPKPCHSKSSKENDDKNSCATDCGKCHICSVNISLNFLSTENYHTSRQPLIEKNVVYQDVISFFSSLNQNIWQPPKLS